MIPCKVKRVIDGDTVDVEIPLVVRVRLQDCWAPERQEPGGLESAQHLEEVLTRGETWLEVPINRGDVLQDLFSFGRVIGRLHCAGKDVSELQVQSGNATKKK